jgi:hypothetical protein
MTTEVDQRQCGRCRKLFEGDGTLNPEAQPDWWLCAPCRMALLGETSEIATQRAR